MTSHRQLLLFHEVRSQTLTVSDDQLGGGELADRVAGRVVISLRSCCCKWPAATNTHGIASRRPICCGPLWSFSLLRAASLSRYELLGHLTRTARPLSGAPSWSCGPDGAVPLGQSSSTTTQAHRSDRAQHCVQQSSGSCRVRPTTTVLCSAVFTRVQVTWEIDLPNIPSQS